MSLIRPFTGLRPAPDRAGDVAAPPYDVLNTDEARARAAGKPWSFLHISKPEIDLPEGTNPYAPEVYAKAAANLARMLQDGVLMRDPESSYYIYRLTLGDHSQTGLVAVASVPDYDSNRIRRHEFTRPDKEDDRVRQIDALNAQTGPVFLAYPEAPGIDAILTQATGYVPEVDIVADTGVRHEIWVLRERSVIQALTAAFDALPALYIADGHHRSAAASRIAATRRAANPAHTGTESYNYFLAVIFPHHQLRILDYNRVVKDLNGLTSEQLLARARENFTVTACGSEVKPASSGGVRYVSAGAVVPAGAAFRSDSCRRSGGTTGCEPAGKLFHRSDSRHQGSAP